MKVREVCQIRVETRDGLRATLGVRGWHSPNGKLAALLNRRYPVRFGYLPPFSETLTAIRADGTLRVIAVRHRTVEYPDDAVFGGV